MTEETFDAIVVGARCAGSSTARLLAQSGLRVLVLDKAAFPSDTISTHGIGPVGVQLLQRWGLLDKILATDVPQEHSVGLKLGETEMQMQIPAGAFAPVCPRRIVLDEILVQAARAAGAEVREQATCRELIAEDGTVVGIRYSDREDSLHDVRARLVIGADGASSFVARAVKARRYDVRPSNVSFRYAYYSGIPIKRVEMAWSHPNFAYVFPTNDGLACMVGATSDADFAAYAGGGDQALQDLFTAASPRLAQALRGGTRQSKFFSFRRQPGRFVVPHGPGWALVGDAGYFKDPVTGQGISDAFAGAQLLANAVIEGFEKPAVMQEALAQYQSLRDELSADAFVATQRLASLEWSNEDLPGIHASYAPSPDKVAKLLGFTPIERVRA
jgi:flavin-dependent dehydrogenase